MTPNPALRLKGRDMDAFYADRLREALERWERSLDTPVVPGELSAWAEACRVDFARVAQLAVEDSQRAHESQYKQMLSESPELSDRVDQLRAADGRLLAAIDAFAATVELLIETADRVEPEEHKARPLLDETVREGLDLVLALRKQEIVIETWFVEALERDRGNVD